MSLMGHFQQDFLPQARTCQQAALPDIQSVRFRNHTSEWTFAEILIIHLTLGNRLQKFITRYFLSAVVKFSNLLFRDFVDFFVGNVRISLCCSEPTPDALPFHLPHVPACCRCTQQWLLCAQHSRASPGVRRHNAPSPHYATIHVVSRRVLQNLPS